VFLFLVLGDIDVHQMDGKPPKAEDEKLTNICATLADIETLLIPVNYNQNHWLLFIMDFKAKRWLFFDSASRSTGKKGRAFILKVRLLRCVVF
jgi:hypothetical protein